VLRRAYIFRNGATDSCAITAVRNAAALPLTSAADRWQFWMQIGPLHAQGGRYGFDIRAALPAIAGGGYYLFTGSKALLNDQVTRRSPQSKESTPDAP
jgi:hypothetical protein